VLYRCVNVIKRHREAGFSLGLVEKAGCFVLAVRLAGNVVLK